MGKFLALLLALAGPLAAGPLAFQADFKEIAVPFEATSAFVDFSFRNTGSETVVIDRAQSDCPCITTAIKGGLVIAPGGEGTIRATMETKALTGVVDKPIGVWLKGDPTHQPSQILRMRVKSPELVVVDPKALIWEEGDPLAPKRITVTMNHSTPIHVTSVTGADNAFRHEWEEIEKGKRYEILVTPVSASGHSNGVLRLDTDCTYERHRSHGIFAVVKGKVKAPEPKKP
jgi:hypothetical protein